MRTRECPWRRRAGGDRRCFQRRSKDMIRGKFYSTRESCGNLKRDDELTINPYFRYNYFTHQFSPNWQRESTRRWEMEFELGQSPHWRFHIHHWPSCSSKKHLFVSYRRKLNPPGCLLLPKIAWQCFDAPCFAAQHSQANRWTHQLRVDYRIPRTETATGQLLLECRFPLFQLNWSYLSGILNTIVYFIWSCGNEGY